MFCEVDGKAYAVGEHFMSDCNECRCEKGQKVSCTLKGCLLANSCEGTLCQPGEFCQRPACGNIGARCAPIPTACDDVHAPVCGCDGVTYPNACEAFAKSSSVRREAECNAGLSETGGSPAP